MAENTRSGEVVEELVDLPPSSKLVFKILRHEGDLTQDRIVEETRLPGRTVRDAVKRLEDRGIVDSRLSFADARKSVYSIGPDVQNRESVGD